MPYLHNWNMHTGQTASMIEKQSLRLANLQVKQFAETICLTTTKYVASLTYCTFFHTYFQDQTSDVALVCLYTQIAASVII